MSHRQNPNWMCFVLMCRFHSFFDVNAAAQLYCAKVHGNGLAMLGPLLDSPFGSADFGPAVGFTSAGFNSKGLGSRG